MLESDPPAELPGNRQQPVQGSQFAHPGMIECSRQECEESQAQRKPGAGSDEDPDVGTMAAEGAGIGGAVGGTLGATVAGLAALGTSLVLPGAGFIVGPVVAALAGAGAGAATGGLVGALVGWGIPEEHAPPSRHGLPGVHSPLSALASLPARAEHLLEMLGTSPPKGMGLPTQE